MKFKAKTFCFEVDEVLIFVILTSLISNTVFNFLYFFFACYLFIFFHELMHILLGSILNKKVIGIKFSISGVCATFKKQEINESRKEYLKNILIYIVGPISNLILAYIFKSNIMIKEINIFLAALNLLPIFPLDGYNILYNFLNIFSHRESNTKIIDFIATLLIIALLLVSIYQIIEYSNFSIIVFCVYLFVLKLNKNDITY